MTRKVFISGEDIGMEKIDQLNNQLHSLMLSDNSSSAWELFETIKKDETILKEALHLINSKYNETLFRGLIIGGCVLSKCKGINLEILQDAVDKVIANEKLQSAALPRKHLYRTSTYLVLSLNISNIILTKGQKEVIFNIIFDDNKLYIHDPSNLISGVLFNKNFNSEEKSKIISRIFTNDLDWSEFIDNHIDGLETWYLENRISYLTIKQLLSLTEKDIGIIIKDSDEATAITEYTETLRQLVNLKEPIYSVYYKKGEKGPKHEDPDVEFQRRIEQKQRWFDEPQKLVKKRR
jgi:hypothetical protein